LINILYDLTPSLSKKKQYIPL